MDQEDIVPLNRYSGFNVAACGMGWRGNGSDSVFGGLAETWTKRWPTINEVETPELPWFTIKKRIQKLRAQVANTRPSD